jgi:hypothetical protein
LSAELTERRAILFCRDAGVPPFNITDTARRAKRAMAFKLVE